LETGILYQFGRDKKLRPVIILNVHLIDNKIHSPEDFLSALVYLLDLVKREMFLPGFVESWIILLETNEIGVTSMPVSFIKQVISTTQHNYPSSLLKLAILNPSFILNTMWSVFKAIIDYETAEKINFMKKKEFPQLLELIPKEQLEEKFGGTHPNLTKFWPPKNTIGDPNVVINNNIWERGFDPQNYRVVNLNAPKVEEKKEPPPPPKQAFPPTVEPIKIKEPAAPIPESLKSPQAQPWIVQKITVNGKSEDFRVLTNEVLKPKP
jgi:hypothetical protein